MSIEEDAELRNLVADTLESNGVLNKIRAELRASVFLALEEQDSLKKGNVANRKLEQFLSSENGFIAASLVNEFLQFFNLDFTSAVYVPETNNDQKFLTRSTLSEKLGVSKDNSPLLLQLIQNRKVTDDGTDALFHKSSSWMGNNGLDQAIPNQTFSPKSSRHTSKPTETAGKSPLSSLADDLSDHSERERIPKSLGMGNANSSAGSRLPPLTGSGKELPPLTGINSQNRISGNAPKSPDWNDLAAIDEKINQLGFEIPKDDFNYEDEDFQPSSSKRSGDGSISEEIEEHLSIGSFAESRNGDDATDCTISHMSDGGYDYEEDILP